LKCKRKGKTNRVLGDFKRTKCIGVWSQAQKNLSSYLFQTLAEFGQSVNFTQRFRSATTGVIKKVAGYLCTADFFRRRIFYSSIVGCDHVRRKDFFHGGTRGFFQNFSRGEKVEICFLPLETT